MYDEVYDARAKIEKELCNLYESIDDAIHEKARRVRVDNLVTKCKDLLKTCIAKNENLIGPAAKTEQAEKLQSELEEWLAVVNKRNDEYMENARDYIDSIQGNENSKKSSQKSHKSLSASTSLKASTARRKDFILGKIRREEVEEENKAADRIAEREYEIEMAEREPEMGERRHEIELFSKKRQIDLEKMHEENRNCLVEAKMQEINLMDDESLLLETATNSSSKHGSIYSTKSENRVKDWVESVGSQKTVILTCKQKKNPALVLIKLFLPRQQTDKIVTLLPENRVILSRIIFLRTIDQK